MSDYYDFGKDSCNLPNECNCSQCNYWGENGWDVNRTPDWQRKPDEDENYE